MNHEQFYPIRDITKRVMNSGSSDERFFLIAALGTCIANAAHYMGMPAEVLMKAIKATMVEAEQAEVEEAAKSSRAAGDN